MQNMQKANAPAVEVEERLVAIRVAGLKKKYRLGVIGAQTLQEELQSWWAKKRGKEDPNMRLGTNPRLLGQTFMALNGVDLTIYKGEAVGIIGANGAGKSTLLKLISQITAPTEGTIDLYGRVASMLEVGTGFHAELTGRENIYLNGAILGMTRKEIDGMMDEIIAFSEIGEYIDTPVKRYSSGMYVKLAFSVAAHLKSEIMIMDEVLAVGDMAFQSKCLDRMRKAAEEEGRTVLYVSHNMNTIRRLCRRCIVLDQGRVIFDGAVDEAVAVYMQHSLGENEVDMDLETKSHSTRPGVQGVRMTRLLLPEKVVPIYGNDEKLRMALTIRAAEPVDCVFRLTLRTDGDVGLGTAWSPEFHLPVGEKTIMMSLPIDPVAKGVFYVSLGLYDVDELGRKGTLDHITRAFRVEISGAPVWSTNAHGYIRLPTIELESEEQTDSRRARV